MKFHLFLLMLLAANWGYSLNPAIKLIPYPQELKLTGDYFTVNSRVNIKADEEMRDVEPYLKILISD